MLDWGEGHMHAHYTRTPVHYTANKTYHPTWCMDIHSVVSYLDGLDAPWHLIN